MMLEATMDSERANPMDLNMDSWCGERRWREEAVPELRRSGTAANLETNGKNGLPLCEQNSGWPVGDQ